MSDADKGPREFDLNQAKDILDEYTKPNSMIDNGNLFFALCEYHEAYLALQKELDAARAEKSVWTKASENVWRERDELRKQLAEAQEEIKKYREALEGISQNACCDLCREAKLVAQKTLNKCSENE